MPRHVLATQPLATEAQPALVTVPNVELLEVGEDWATSTGVFSFTSEDLVAAVSSQQDPGVRTPIIKLGHVDPRFDGQPAIGRIENLRTENNGQTLVGDLVGVPLWLAQCMASAYPRRSIEGEFNCKTQTGNDWGFVLTGLALLGTAYPAITTLEDVKALWGATPPPLYPADEVPGEVAAAGSRIFQARKADEMPKWKRDKVAAGEAVRAQTSLDDVRQQYYNGLNSSQMWWWIREIRVNPLELIVDDDEGQLYSIPVQLDDQDNITFGAPQAVKVEYVAAATRQIVAASYDSSQTSGRPSRKPESSGVVHSAEEEESMPDPKVLEALGLKSDTTQAEVDSAVLQRLSAQPTEDEGGKGAGKVTTEPGTETPETSDEPKAQPEAPEAPAEKPSDVQVPEGMVLVDATQWANVQQGVAAAQRLEKQAQDTEKNGILDAAVQAGKFPPARREHYATMFSADPEGTKKIIASLAPGLVPVQERGKQGGESEAKVEAAAYPDSWKPTVAASRVSTSTRVKVVND